MKKYSVFMTILAAVSMIACQKEQEKDNEPVVEPEKEVVLTTISATAGEAETKTYVDGLQVKWSKDDVIAVANEDDDLVEFTLKGEGGVASGSFDGDLSGKALGNYAVYPNTTNAAIAGNMASVDYKTTWTYGKSEVPMYGVNDGAGAYTFNNIGGAIQISYTNVPASAAKFVLTETHTGAATKPITGTVEIDDLDSTPTFDLSGLDGQTVTITGVTPDGEGNAQFVIPIPASDGYIFRFELQTSDGETIPGTQKIASNQTINANKIKRFPGIAIPATLPDVKTLTFDFSSTSASGWPASAPDAGELTYTLNTVGYDFYLSKVGSGIYQNASYLILYSGNGLGFPIIENYRLSKVSLHTSSTCSQTAKVAIVSNLSSKPIVNDSRSTIMLTERNADFVLDITASYKDKRYYLYMDDKNTQVTSITLTYEESSRTFSPTTLVMSPITCSSRTSSSLTFSWTGVSGAAGYQISKDDDSHFGSTQLGTSFTYNEINPFTEYTIYVKAIGDGADYLDSSAGSATAKTTLAIPSSITWTEGTKTVAWTDNNSSAGEYGTIYKYVYSLDNGVSSSDATSSTTAVLSIDATSTCRVKAICISDASLSSGWSSGTDCTISGSSVTGVIYHENFGTPTGNTTMASFSEWEKGGSLSQSSVTYSYVGSTASPIRKTSASSGYTGASGDGNLYTASGGALTVSNINVTGANYVTFSCGTQATSANTVVTYKFNTQSVASSLSATTSKTTGPETWGLVSYTKIAVPSGATSLQLVITINSNSRIDDLQLNATAE